MKEQLLSKKSGLMQGIRALGSIALLLAMTFATTEMSAQKSSANKNLKSESTCEWTINGECKTHPEQTATILRLRYDEANELVSILNFETFQDALADTTYDYSLKLFADVEITSNIQLPSTPRDLYINLNGHTLDGSHEEGEWYEDEDGENEYYVSYTNYHIIECRKNIVIENGTVLCNIVEYDEDTNGYSYTIKNANLKGNHFCFCGSGGVQLINSTFYFKREDGEGSLLTNAFHLDETSMVTLIGINKIGSYSDVALDVKELMHRLVLPEGYVIKKSHWDDHIFTFYSVDNLEYSANMRDIVIMAKGSDPLSECELSNYYSQIEVNVEEGTWYEHHLCCPICLAEKEDATVRPNPEGELTCENFVLTDGKEYYIDMDSDEHFTAKHFTYDRSVTGGSCVSFVLPAELPVSQFNGKLWQYDTFADNIFKFTEVTDEFTQANTPYLMEVDKNATKLLKGSLENISVYSSLNSTSLGGTDGASSHIGTYEESPFVSGMVESYYDFNANITKFKKLSSVTLLPFRSILAKVVDAEDIVENNLGFYWESTNHEDDEEEFSEAIEVELNEGDIFSFDWTTFSEDEYDLLYGYVNTPADDENEFNKFFEESGYNSGDDEEGTPDSARDGQYDYPAPQSGKYIFKFSYYKDSSDSFGEDKVAITDVNLFTVDHPTEITLQLGERIVTGIVIGDGQIDVNALKGANGKIVENGHIVIVKNGERYDLMGRKM